MPVQPVPKRAVPEHVDQPDYARNGQSPSLRCPALASPRSWKLVLEDKEGALALLLTVIS